MFAIFQQPSTRTSRKTSLNTSLPCHNVISAVEDNTGSANLLRHHAAAAGVAPRLELDAADLPGKLALVATGHAVALIPSSLADAVRPDVTVLELAGAPTRGIHVLLPVRHPHPDADALIGLIRDALS